MTFLCTTTINDESLEWLKFGGFGELIEFTKLSSANLLWDHETFINFMEICQTFIHQSVWEPDSPNFSHFKLSSFTVYNLATQCKDTWVVLSRKVLSNENISPYSNNFFEKSQLAIRTNILKRGLKFLVQETNFLWKNWFRNQNFEDQNSSDSIPFTFSLATYMHAYIHG